MHKSGAVHHCLEYVFIPVLLAVCVGSMRSALYLQCFQTMPNLLWCRAKQRDGTVCALRRGPRRQLVMALLHKSNVRSFSF
jgi:hypothetical protein